MKKDFVEYLPYIIVPLLVASGFAIYERGGFERENNTPSPPPVSIAQTALPTVTPTPTVSPTNPPKPIETPAPVFTQQPLGTTPSIFRRGGEDDR